MDKFKTSGQLLSEEILNGFIQKITFSQATRLVGNTPENALLTGRLSSIKDIDSKDNINSIGLDFYIDEDYIDTAEVKIYPNGDFYYRVLPTYEEEKEAMLKVINSLIDNKYENFDEVINDYFDNKDYFNRFEDRLLDVYKKVSLSDKDISVSFKMSDILDGNKEYAFVDENHRINTYLNEQLDILYESIISDNEFVYNITDNPIKIKDLINKESYNNFLSRYGNKNIRRKNKWNIFFNIKISKRDDKYLISCYLINNSSALYILSRYSNNKVKIISDTMFNSGVKVKLINAKFSAVKSDFFKDDYKYEEFSYASGNNCAVEYIKEEMAVKTTNIPVYNQYRLITNDDLSVEFTELIKEPTLKLEEILSNMYIELDEWRNYEILKEKNLSDKAKAMLKSEIKAFEDEILNFKSGIDILKKYNIVKKSFVLMNEVFLKSAQNYSSWRLFQIVFIVSLIPDIVSCDRYIMTKEEKEKANLSKVSLLYFPTGSGKTEAFLGILVFNLFFDRYRGKAFGVTGILKYPLRLLSVQQVRRLANILAQAELLRREIKEISSLDEFALGYYVGSKNTPNSMSTKDYNRYNLLSQTRTDEKRVIDICPFCKKNTVHLKADENLRRLVHYCDNKNCPSGGILPLYIVDNEIYRFLPSVIISTVDKISVAGCNPNFRNIIDSAEYKCPVHGYTSKRKCIERSCDESVKNYEKCNIYDPAPSIIIQDELHLIREALGTYSSHYEAFLKYYIKNKSKSQRDVKIIGATATISSYKEQVYNLYGKDCIRFPCESPYIDRNFYSKIDYNDLNRRIIGFAPFGNDVEKSVTASLKYMREVICEYKNNPDKILQIEGIEITKKEEALKLLEEYWIFLEYNGVKRDSNAIDANISGFINDSLIQEGVIPFEPSAMTGDETFQNVRKVLSEVENTLDIYNGINLITATSMISHGVDTDRFNIMFFYGLPSNMAEYVQAYSRCARKYPGIVVDVIRPGRETDLDYLKNFVNMHKYKDSLIEPVCVNRWAVGAIDNTVCGIFTALLFACYDPKLQYLTGSLFYMKNIAKAIRKNLVKKDIIIGQMTDIFECSNNENKNKRLNDVYIRKINNFLNDIFVKIPSINWSNENIFDGFSLMGYKIMKSLRDSDARVSIELK